MRRFTSITSRRLARGISLIEMLTAVMVASILSTMALPTMITLVRDNRATAAINGIIGQVQYTRSTAITARRTVTLCPRLQQEWPQRQQ